ncbi:MAG: outer membrane beta-barrel protein [Rickettsiales bacterium]|nr:outer membrane beta-barrel protein [Rickettsiales bacterium]
MIYKTLLLTIITTFSASFCYAESSQETKSPQKKNFYIGTTIGYAEPTSFKNNTQLKDEHGTITYGILAGTTLNDWFRTGVEITHRNKAKISSTIPNIQDPSITLSSTSAFLNGYIKIPDSCPYLILGIGQSYNKFGNFKNNNGILNQGKNTTNFAYQVGLGFTTNYKMLSFDSELKYADKGTAKTKTNSGGTVVKADIKDILFSIAIRYNF